MEMPTPCPGCGNVVEFNDMLNHPNEFKTMVCEECHDRIEEENNRGEQTDNFCNKLEWIANPDDGLIDFKVNGDPITTWSYEDDPELSFHDFLSIWNKAQESIALAQAAHADDLAIDRFAAAMKAKMAAARAKGRSGWDDPERCSGEMLAAELVSHLSKNNPGTFEDVANFAMMLHQRNESPSLLLDEVNGLKEQVEELKAMFVDALGDGFYDGYLKCKKDFEEQRDNEPWYISKVGDNDVIAMSEDYESNHRYSKSINDIKAAAVMNFAEVNRGAYLSGFVPAELTVYDVYQSARNHVKDNYAHETAIWDDDDATTARNAIVEIRAQAIESINVVEFTSMALRHVDVSGDFDHQDIKDAFIYIAAEIRNQSKDGE